MGDLGSLLRTYKVRCRGIGDRREDVLSKENAEKVIVKVYRDGKSIPLCRHYPGKADGRCGAAARSYQGLCPYVS